MTISTSDLSIVYIFISIFLLPTFHLLQQSSIEDKHDDKSVTTTFGVNRPTISCFFDRKTALIFFSPTSFILVLLNPKECVFMCVQVALAITCAVTCIKPENCCPWTKTASQVLSLTSLVSLCLTCLLPYLYSCL